MWKLFHKNIIFNRQQAHGYVQEYWWMCVLLWLMNVVVYNLKSLISIIKASVCKKSYTSRKAAHACMHPSVLIIFHTASYMLTSIRVTGWLDLKLSCVWPVDTPTKWSNNQTSLLWHLSRNIPDSKWRLQSNILARVSKTSETVVICNN